MVMRDEIEDRYSGFRAEAVIHPPHTHTHTSMGKCWFEATTIGLSKDTIWGKAETQTSHTHAHRMWDVSSLVGYRLYVDAQRRQRSEQ